MDRPLQNVNDIDESKIIEVYDNLVWYKLPLDNGWTSYTLRAVDCMHDNVEIYNKDNIYSDDGYTSVLISHIFLLNAMTNYVPLLSGMAARLKMMAKLY